MTKKNSPSRGKVIPKRTKREGKTIDIDSRPKRIKDTTESLDRYLEEIGQIPLLSFPEEQALAKRVREQKDPAALKKLTTSNLRFVVSVAKQYQGQGMSLSDLINEGNIGLMKAAARFDETRGFKFISYAVWWVRQAILQALSEQSRIVRIPLNKVGELQKVIRTRDELEMENGLTPDSEQIAKVLGMREEEVTQALQIQNSHLSLDAPFAGAEDVSLMDKLEDERVVSPDQQALARSLRETIDECLALLDPREEMVIRLYTGVSDEARPLTLEEIGVRLGITRERVRQIKEKALRRLRKRAKALKGFL